jgi:hypothetical protein
MRTKTTEQIAKLNDLCRHAMGIGGKLYQTNLFATA